MAAVVVEAPASSAAAASSAAEHDVAYGADEEKKAAVADATTMGQLLLRAAQAVLAENEMGGALPVSTADLVINDPDAEDDDVAQRGVTPHEQLLSFLLDCNIDLGQFAGLESFMTAGQLGQMARNSFNNPRDYSSCGPFADGLMGKIAGRKIAEGTTSKANSKAVKQGLIDELCGHMAKMAPATVAGEVGYAIQVQHGIHSFTILIRNGQAEILQVFAGPTGFSIGANIQKNQTYAIDVLCGHLSKMIHGGQADNTQGTLFGGGIDDASPNYDTSYSMHELLPEDAITKVFNEQISNRLAFLKKYIPDGFTKTNWS